MTTDSVDERSSQRSIRIWGNELPDDQRRLMDRFNTFYGSMLSQDLASVIPYRDAEFRIEVVPGDDEESRAILTAALGGRRRGSLEDAVAEFMRHFCAPTVVLCGEAMYEIVYLQDEQGREVAFRLSPVTSGTYRRMFGKYLQTVPKTYAVAHGVDRRVWLDRRDTVLFSLPRETQGKTERMVDVFEAAQKRHQAMADLTEKALKEKLPFDFRAHQDSIDLMIAKATSCIGWDARWTFREKQLEPYQVHRHLRFAAFKVQLRDMIIDRLNDVLKRVGPRIGREMQLALGGLPAMADVRVAQQQLADGQRSMTDLLTAFL